MSDLFERLAEVYAHRADDVPRRAADAPAVLSFEEEGLWVLDRLDPGVPVYNLPCSLHIEGLLDVQALRNALRDLVARHDVLRTGFPSRGGRPWRAIQARGESDLDLVIDDLTDATVDEREAEVSCITEREAKAPFSLDRAPLWRARLLRLGETRYVLLLTFHHVITDSWSTGVLFRDLAVLYGARRGLPVPPPRTLSIEYADHAVWQRSPAAREAIDRQLPYWRAQLDGLEPLGLPTDRPRPAARSQRGDRVSMRLPRALVGAMQRLCAAEDATLFMGLLAAFQSLLQRASGRDDIAVGTPVANRVRAQTHDLVGLFVNALVLRTDLSGSPGFHELLARTRETALQAYRHQDMPLHHLVDQLNPPRSRAHTPLFQVMFVLQNAPRESIRLPDLQARETWRLPDTSRFDLTLEVRGRARSDADDDFNLELEYDRDLFDSSTIAGLLDGYVAILREATKR